MEMNIYEEFMCECRSNFGADVTIDSMIKKIKWAWLEYNLWDRGKYKKIRLKSDRTEADEFAFKKFMMDNEYNPGFGAQELFGMIVFDDCWFERHEYDGSEWWEVKKFPTEPDWLD